jgi:RNA polymerase sigma-70 factor (ECF subfamily)
MPPQGDIDVEQDRAAEHSLVMRAKSGDVAAFEEIYRMHAGRTLALCRRLAGDSALAEDIFQEVFVQAWQKLHMYRGESSLATWLYRIAANAVLDACRANRRRQLWLDAFRWVWKPAAVRRDPALRADLDAVIAALPIKARTIFVLHDVEGYRHEEISLMLGLAPGTCKAQLHNARRMLRKELGL